MAGRSVLLIVGDGAARASLERQVADFDDNRVRFLPFQPRESLADSLSAADLHVVSMHPRITGCLCPSKLYGILAAGRPVLAISNNQTDLAQTVIAEQLGWTCQPGDVSGIARAVETAASSLEMLDRMGKRARQLALQRFDRPVVLDQFSELIHQVYHRVG